MACTSPFFGSHGPSNDGETSSVQMPNGSDGPVKRRHSHFIPRRRSIVGHMTEGEDGLLLKVDLFLSELERRLDYLESYSELSLDASISRAFSTLQAVRTRCSQVSEEVIGAGRRRLHVMVETLESGYQEALARAGSLNEKAKVGIEILDDMLNDFEARAIKIREQSLTEAAGRMLDEGRRVVDESLEHAREVMNGGLGRALRAAESMEERIQRAIGRAREKGLLRHEDLPVPWQINPHIHSGYRFCETQVGCVLSAFGFSNEMVNIWSHGLGLVVVLAIAFYFYPSSISFSLSNNVDVFIAAVFFFAACQCLACSTIWHTMNSIADVSLVSMFACVDYTGISLLIAASIMTSEYTAFYCEPVSRWIYMTTTALLGIGGVILPWHPTFNGNDMAWARVAFFVCLALTGFLPVFQILLARGHEFVWETYSPVLKSVAVYFFGACIYAGKVPERWLPGKFDFLANSHQIWHIAVLGGILFHYTAMQDSFAGAFRRAQTECPAH